MDKNLDERICTNADRFFISLTGPCGSQGEDVFSEHHYYLGGSRCPSFHARLDSSLSLS